MDNSFWFLNNFTQSGTYHTIATPSTYDGNFHSICEYGYPDYPSGLVNIMHYIILLIY